VKITNDYQFYRNLNGGTQRSFDVICSRCCYI